MYKPNMAIRQFDSWFNFKTLSEVDTLGPHDEAAYWRRFVLQCGTPLFVSVAVVVVYWLFLCMRNGCLTWLLLGGSGSDYWCFPNVKNRIIGFDAGDEHGGFGLFGVRFLRDSSKGCHAAWPRRNPKRARLYLVIGFGVVMILSGVTLGARDWVAKIADKALNDAAHVSEDFRHMRSLAVALNTSAKQIRADASSAFSFGANASNQTCAGLIDGENFTAAVLTLASVVSGQMDNINTSLGDADGVLDHVSKDMSTFVVGYVIGDSPVLQAKPPNAPLKERFSSTPSPLSTITRRDLVRTVLVYEEVAAYAMVVGGFIFSILGILGAVAPEKNIKCRAPVLRVSSNLLALNNATGVAWVLFISALLSAHLLLGSINASFCQTGASPSVAFRAALLRDNSFRTSLDTQSAMAFYLNCESAGDGFLAAQLNATISSLEHINTTIQSYQSKAANLSCEPSPSLTSLQKVVNRATDTFAADLTTASACRTVASPLDELIVDKLCASLPLGLGRVVRSHTLLLISIMVVLFTASFQRQAIYEGAKVSTHPRLEGYDSPVNDNDAAVVEMMGSVYYTT